MVADRVNGKRFYAMALFDGKLFESTDGAAPLHGEGRWCCRAACPKRGGNGKDNRTDRGDDRGGQDRLYTTPGREGDLVAGGLRRPLPRAREAGVRSDAGGRADPRLRLRQGGAAREDAGALPRRHGVEGQRGFFRSTDGGATWLRINDDQHQWGLVLQITGDPKKFGRVYVGTHGRGTFYGDPK